MTYIKRAAEETIARISEMFLVLLVTGPRQVGKTTLLQKLADAFRRRNLQNPKSAVFNRYQTANEAHICYKAAWTE